MSFRAALHLLLVFVLAGLAPAAALENPLRIHGSTTFHAEIMVPFQNAIESVTRRPLDVVASKSSWGLLSLFEGRSDVAMISAPLHSEIVSAGKARPEFPYADLREFRIGVTRTAFAIHTSNPVTRLSLADVGRIFKGEVTNWKELGGPDRAILVVAVKEGGGTVAAVRAQMLGDAAFPTSAVRVESANHVLKVVSQEPGAVGIAQLGLIRRAKLHEIVTERVVEQPLSFVTLGQPSPDVERLIEAARTIAARVRD
jgi:phosphate transport system substrate-binding protein